MTIVGTAGSPTSGSVTIIRQSDGEHAVINIPASTSGTVTIRNLEIIGGSATGSGEVDGDGIYLGAGSTLALGAVLVTDNPAVGAAGPSASRRSRPPRPRSPAPRRSAGR